MPELVKAIFASDVGVDNEAVDAQGRRLLVVRSRRRGAVAAIAARRGRAAVIKALQESEAQKQLAAKANELARRIDSGESLAALAAANGVAGPAGRGRQASGGAGLTEAAVKADFRHAGRRRRRGPGRQGRAPVFKVLDAMTPPLDPRTPVIAGLMPRLDSALADDLFTNMSPACRRNWA